MDVAPFPIASTATAFRCKLFLDKQKQTTYHSIAPRQCSNKYQSLLSKNEHMENVGSVADGKEHVPAVFSHQCARCQSRAGRHHAAFPQAVGRYLRPHHGRDLRRDTLPLRTQEGVPAIRRGALRTLLLCPSQSTGSTL